MFIANWERDELGNLSQLLRHRDVLYLAQIIRLLKTRKAMVLRPGEYSVLANEFLSVFWKGPLSLQKKIILKLIVITWTSRLPCGEWNQCSMWTPASYGL